MRYDQFRDALLDALHEAKLRSPLIDRATETIDTGNAEHGLSHERSRGHGDSAPARARSLEPGAGDLDGKGRDAWYRGGVHGHHGSGSGDGLAEVAGCPQETLRGRILPEVV